MTLEEIQAELSKLVEKMTAKGAELPEATYMAKPKGVKDCLHMAARISQNFFGGTHYACTYGYDPSEVIESAHALIDALPDPETKVIREYQRKVADAVDYGTEHALDEKLVAPLRGVSQAITDNLLTDQSV